MRPSGSKMGLSRCLKHTGVQQNAQVGMRYQRMRFVLLRYALDDDARASVKDSVLYAKPWFERPRQKAPCKSSPLVRFSFGQRTV